MRFFPFFKFRHKLSAKTTVSQNYLQWEGVREGERKKGWVMQYLKKYLYSAKRS